MPKWARPMGVGPKAHAGWAGGPNFGPIMGFADVYFLVNTQDISSIMAISYSRDLVGVPATTIEPGKSNTGLVMYFLSSS
jgi:hypothetical protein